MFRTFKNCSHFRKKFQISKFVHPFFLFMKYVWNYEIFSRFFNLFMFSERMTISKLFIISKKYKKKHKCFKSAATFCSLEFALYKFYSISFSWNVSVQIYQNFSNMTGISKMFSFPNFWSRIQNLFMFQFCWDFWIVLHFKICSNNSK